jgi:hypothetical protein
VLPANASQVRNDFWDLRLFVRYRERREQDAHTTAAKMDGGTKDLSTADFQSAVALCFQPTLLKPENTLDLEIVRPLSRTV